VFGGLVMAAGYALTALVMLILIITIPFGIASARIALFCLWPFGRIVRRPDAQGLRGSHRGVWAAYAS
jgi:uncharacterized membrane protein YccF (DUF307 family)